MNNPSLILFKSVTYAQRGGRVLAQKGISSYMIRSQAALGGGSCSYALKVRPETLSKALAVLNETNIPYGKVYQTDPMGRFIEYR